ncbi:MAG: ATP-dependent zinc metalloprotease FtsH 1 [Candidatus Wolfebacteria bacterium GW2011_GWA2_42_10]|uniref:ATP-dependent zinc metalloprotease FtsH n=2 Tax=Candidatus Wolfeibacteriota TaxID=1752735 RepID=A0A0G0XK71_9BACT|nr:MAG: ATP-dependent zinc metalloprotease FtsH 1 [Candidatus Wolfebacteria bacterium GW2011_GWB1_41_12]KKS25289.1 MAG: ATP-dependent zinc metalloprotease FtsH 1 [Candidatus Wolfebacteria bacterium GW2011_GWA2_42_10]KKT56729.1 MAG: ATP-dependent zinc metalloprotease FtsH 1 [Candidatus Wolfebacteria bacterium GW2011_GWA1_44_24]
MMNNLSKNILWAVMTLLIIAFVFSLLYSGQKTPAVLTLDQLATKINSGEVSKIVVSGNDLKIELKTAEKAVSKKEAETSLTETLKNYGVEPLALQKVGFEIQEESGLRFWLSILIPSLLPLIIIGVFFWLMFRQAKTGMSQAFTFGKANIKLFSQFKDRITFEDVAGLKEAKQELMEVVDFLKNPKKYLEIGAKIPRGVLLYGAPGTGKTLLARAVAGEANVPFFHISGSEFVEMFVGVGASRVRDLFDTAKKAGRSIIFIDEIDAVGRERGAGLGGGHDEREQTLNQILVEMDGFEKNDARIVIAATNRPDVLDPALLRPGRFDRRVILDLPDINDREEILKIHSLGKMLVKDISLRRVAERTPGFSGADLANLMNEAAISAARQNKLSISQQDIFDSVEKVLLGPERRSRILSKKEKEITAYHEAGHALVAAGLKNADPVHKVSIVARGRAGGYTMKLPIEETYLRTKSQFMADLATMLGGYVSEKIVFSDISTGASNDLQSASSLARKLVTKFGMSEKLGPITFGKTDELVFLGREIAMEKNYSEKVAAEIDKEIKEIIEKARQAAKRIIVSKRKSLEKLAKTLMEKETLEREEFESLIKSFKLRTITV